jgi:hypothetical protein
MNPVLFRITKALAYIVAVAFTYTLCWGLALLARDDGPSQYFRMGGALAVAVLCGAFFAIRLATRGRHFLAALGLASPPFLAVLLLAAEKVALDVADWF